MKEINVKLKDGTLLNTKTDFLWNLREDMNDTRTAFIEIGNLCINKSEIVSIVHNELTEVHNEFGVEKED